MNNVMVSAVSGIGAITIDGQKVLNVSKITVDAGKSYVVADVTFIPSDVVVSLEGTVLVCEHCGGGLVLRPSHEESR